MSNSNFGSFKTNTEYNELIFSSFGSSQSTQATDMSYNYPDPTFQQTSDTIGQTNLFNNIGYGAPDALGGILPNPNVPVRAVYGPTVPTPSPGLQQQKYIKHPEPWSPFARSQGYASYPYPNVGRTSTQGPWELGYQPAEYYAYQSTSSSDGWQTGQSQDISFQAQGQNSVLPPQSPSSSGQSEKLLLPKQRKKPRAALDQQRVKPSYPCPECDERLSRPEGVTRHILTCHTGKEGPFWLCDVCGFWEYNVREAKMRAHCREKHPEMIEVHLQTKEDIFPYQQVLSVGDQEFDPRPSTDGTRTRRRKRRVT